MNDPALHAYTDMQYKYKSSHGKGSAMTVWQPTDDGHADLASHDAFATGAPHNTFARMRREEPLAWTEWSRIFWR
jgi:hypothetical protein